LDILAFLKAVTGTRQSVRADWPIVAAPG